MTTTKRTDPHSPASIIPADYEFQFAYARPRVDPESGFVDPGYNAELLAACRTGREFSVYDGPIAQPILDENGKPRRLVEHRNGGCAACGAHHLDGSVYVHEPSGDLVAFGHVCAGKLDLAADLAAFRRYKRDTKRARFLALERERRRLDVERFLAENDGLADDLAVEHGIIADIGAKLRRFGSISEAQVGLVRKIAREARERAARGPEVHVPAPTGRQVVEGTVVSVKLHETVYGDSFKMTVRVEADGGSWLAWGTVPANLLELALRDDEPKLGRGDRVRFTATLKPGRDAHFALYSRPTKAERLSIAGQD